jgi:excisionase family DNA binding protein
MTTEVKASPQSAWLTAAEAADYLRIKPRSLLLWVRQGKLQAYALSGTKRRIWRFRKEDLDVLSKPVISPQKLMRHSDIQTTFNIYGDIVTDEMQQASSRIAGLALRTDSRVIPSAISH